MEVSNLLGKHVPTVPLIAMTQQSITPPSSPFDTAVEKKQEFRLPSINNILNSSVLDNNNLAPVLAPVPSPNSYVPYTSAPPQFAYSNPYTPMSSRSASLTSINSQYSSGIGASVGLTNNVQYVPQALPQLPQIGSLHRSSSLPINYAHPSTSTAHHHHSASISSVSSSSSCLKNEVDSGMATPNSEVSSPNYNSISTSASYRESNRFRTNSIQSDNFKPIIMISADKNYEYIQKTQGRKKRSNLPKKTTVILLSWLNDNLNHPYPNAKQKSDLMKKTGLSSQQLSNWFINARRRKISLLKELKTNTTLTE